MPLFHKRHQTFSFSILNSILLGLLSTNLCIRARLWAEGKKQCCEVAGFFLFFWKFLFFFWTCFSAKSQKNVLIFEVFFAEKCLDQMHVNSNHRKLNRFDCTNMPRRKMYFLFLPRNSKINKSKGIFSCHTYYICYMVYALKNGEHGAPSRRSSWPKLDTYALTKIPISTSADPWSNAIGLSYLVRMPYIACWFFLCSLHVGYSSRSCFFNGRNHKSL